MKDYFKNIADTLGLDFTYAPNNYQNLNTFDADNPVAKFMLFPLTKRPNYTQDSGLIESTTWSSTLMILQKDDFDNDYETKSDGSIASSFAIIDSIKSTIECSSEYVVNNWQEEEVINLFDMNASGVLVTFQVIER